MPAPTKSTAAWKMSSLSPNPRAIGTPIILTACRKTRPLDFHSPYGCSKGAGDQYTRDYARIYGLRTVVMRQSCIYGYRQFGIEDQGWVAWFIIAALKGRPISIYGDGKQVRDILFIDDLLDAYDAAYPATSKPPPGRFTISAAARTIP
jgi:nucleoside-diphosphate-sugar epimerase